MPKRRTKKNSDFLQFRPYHAFAAQAVRPARAGGGIRWWHAVLIVGALLLLFAAAVGLSYR
jgi:hypothetical protein